MKKLMYVLLSAGIAVLVACGPSAEEKAAQQQAEQDSIAKAQKAIEDSIAMVQQAAEAQRVADSTNAANMEKARMDSIAATQKKKSSGKKPAPKPIEKGQPLPNRPGAVKK